MSTTPFRITDIVWPVSDLLLPPETILNVPNWLTDLGYEDCEPAIDEGAGESRAGGPDSPAASHDDDDEYDDHELDDDYQPSEAALEAFEAEWDQAVKDLLAERFGVSPISIGSYGPAEHANAAACTYVEAPTEQRSDQEEAQFPCRYLVFVQDDPVVLTNRYTDRDQAVAFMESVVEERFRLNGCGHGAVLDSGSDEIVAVRGMPMPNDDDALQLGKLIRDLHAGYYSVDNPEAYRVIEQALQAFARRM